MFISILPAVVLGGIGILFFLFFSIVSKHKWGVVASIFILCFSLGILRFHIADKSAPEVFESQVGQKADFSGQIVDEPDVKPSNQQLTVSVDTGGEKTKVLVSADLGQDFKYGDDITFTGKLKKPENFLTDQGKTFDYINYLRKDGILYVISYPTISITSRGNGSVIKSALFSVKEKFLDKINYLIPNPESIFMGGLILGDKSPFDQAMRANFVNTGTIHIVALSGYNVTIVAEWFMTIFALLWFMPKNFGIGMGIFAILLFILMTGGSSTAIRAGIMATLALIARATGRNYDVARALTLAAVFMIILNPFVLVYDVSFQLSMLATIAVIFFAPRIEKYFMWVMDRYGLRDIVAITVAAYIFVFPFILYKMGNFSVVALPTNVLILPFIPFTMLMGFLTGFVGLIWSTLAIPFAYVSYLLLHYELSAVGFFANLPFAAFTTPNFPLWITLLIYAYFTYFLFGRSIKDFFQEKPTVPRENFVQ
jgi:competence protein ComEC